MFLGIDLGTSSVKVLLLDEQHPHDWWAALNRAMRELKTRVPRALAEVRGIGLAGQMHGAVVLDERHEVLRPAILWNDTRQRRKKRHFHSQKRL